MAFGRLHEKQLCTRLFDCISVRVRIALNAPSRTLTLNNRDGEAAYVSLNGNICWATSITASQGTQQCGGQSPWHDEAVPVTGCSISLSGPGDKPVTVRVWTTLDSRHPSKESFGIRNVVIQNDPPGN